jgi:hypothetical protein
VQVELASIVAPDRPTVVPPGAALTEPAVQVVVAFGVAATNTFAGSASVNATDESAIELAAVLAIVTVNVDVPFIEMSTGLNAFESVTPETLPMLRTALAGDALVAPCVEVTFEAGTVFV